MLWEAVLVVVTVWTGPSAGYPTGAPPEQCLTMTPNHHGANASTAASPYTLVPSTTTYTPGTPMSVSVQGGAFKGILLQARRATDGRYAGTFADPPQGFHDLACNTSGDSVTHSNRDNKTAAMFEWIPPSPGVGDVVFKATIVKSHEVFWTDVTSVTVNDVTTVLATTPAVPTSALDVELRLTSEDFHSDLLDPATARHQVLQLAVRGEVDRIFEDHPHYRSSRVNHFRQGSVITNVTLDFKKNLTEEEKYEAAAQLFQASESGNLGFTTDRVTVNYGDGTSDTLERCTCSGQPSVTCTTKGGTCVPTCVLNKNYCNTGTCSSDLSAKRLNCKCPSNFVGDRCDNPQIGGLSPAAFACVLLAALAGFVLLGCVICHLCCAERCGKGGKHKAYNQGKPAAQPTQTAQTQKPPVEQEEQVATVDMSKPAAGDDGTYTNPSLPRSEAGSIMETIQEEPSDASLITEPGGIARPVIPAPLPMAGKQRPLAADPGQQEAIENWRRHVVPKAAPPTASLQPEAPSHGSLPKRILETPRIPEASPMLPLKKRAPDAPPLGSLKNNISEAPPIASLQNRIPDTPAVGSLQKRIAEAPPADFLRNRIPDSASDVTDEVAQLTARWPAKGGGTKSLGRRLPVRAPAGTRPATVRGIYNPGYYDNFGNIKEMSYKNAEEIA
ncbi:PREDICTED: uncharacterized protein LOC109481653 [Branchiostoma belcheri]|uniref:Uncharacterized protein LOC109481653 n=1 Tax=Branchiostoma belcheri TaxID=7741 RepID=A0A6P5ADE6_BRABE|nr:PREDICTED: uncharacterized protein LOC109481653 [Branchiostoma belcheri]